MCCLSSRCGKKRDPIRNSPCRRCCDNSGRFPVTIDTRVAGVTPERCRMIFRAYTEFRRTGRANPRRYRATPAYPSIEQGQGLRDSANDATDASLRFKIGVSEGFARLSPRRRDAGIAAPALLRENGTERVLRADKPQVLARVKKHQSAKRTSRLFRNYPPTRM